MLTGLLFGLLVSACRQAPAPAATQPAVVTHAQLAQLSSAADLATLLRWQPDAPVLISAHRGGPAPGFPENCLETFQYTLSEVPAIIECDVQVSADGVPVLMHDATLDRTSTGQGPVSSLTWAQLSQLHLKDPAGQVTPWRIPRLDSTLAWARGRTVLSLDVKDTDTTHVLPWLRRAQAWHYVFVITYNTLRAALYHQAHPQLWISATMRNSTELARITTTEGVDAQRLVAFTGTAQSVPQHYQALHNRGIRATIGTLGNLDRSAQARGPRVYQEIRALGADAFATDTPVAVLQALTQPATAPR